MIIDFRPGALLQIPRAHSGSVWTWFVGPAAVVDADPLGLEFTIPTSRQHYTIPDSRPEFSIPISRQHFTIPEED